MDEVLNKLFENMSQEEISRVLINFNLLQLNKKSHIKKYKRLRKVHSDILYSMKEYIFSHKYDVTKYDDVVMKELDELDDDFEIEFDFDESDDLNIFLELFVYDNHPDIKSVTDVYLKKKKFRNQEKLKFLKAMKDSYAGLFKMVGIDSEEGYVIYQDVFTNKKFKVVDIAASSTLAIPDDKELYTYNRIITVEGISFMTGLHCNFSSECEEFMDFIKSDKYKRYSSFVRCMHLYDIYRNYSDITCNSNYKYGRKWALEVNNRNEV